MLLVGAAASAALEPPVQDLYEAAKRWIRRAHSEDLPGALEEADRRTAAFLVAFVRELRAAQARATAAGESPPRLDTTEPDISATLRSAVLASARTPDPARHETVARLVAERLRTGLDSDKAAATRLAVDVIDRLSNRHLSLLGLLALIYAVRPPNGWEDSAPQPRFDHIKDEPRETAKPRYEAWVQTHAEPHRAWLAGHLERHEIAEEFTGSDAAHLAAASCVVIGRGVRRKLTGTILTLPGEKGLEAYRFRHHRARNGVDLVIDDSVKGRAVRRLWTAGLRELSLTPAGLLIGLSVHDTKTGDHQSALWQFARTHDLPNVIEGDEIWDGKEKIFDTFRDALVRDIKDALWYRRGPWYDLLHKLRD